VPHPGDDSDFGTLLNGDAFGPGDGATSDRRGVVRNRTGQFVGHVAMAGVEGQECHDRPVEILDILGMGFVPASGVGFLTFGILFGGPFGFKVGTDVFDDRCRCPYAFGEGLSAFFSWTIQWGPAALTLRVKAASPGRSSAQPSGAVWTSPLGDRTLFGVGPGE
jgi:hypothetical protein